MPTSSVAMAQRDGKSLNEKVLGTAPPPTPLPVPGQSGWPPRPTGREDRGRGRGRPPSGKLTVGAEGGPAPEADAATSQRSNVTLQEKAAQLERELQQLKQQMAGRPASASLAETTSRLPDFPPPPPPRPSTADREAARAAFIQRRAVDEFEAILVQKLIARTPLGGIEETGALKTLTRAFTYYDAAQMGTVTLEGFTKVLAKLGCITTVPPSDRMRPLVAGLFAKYARDGELEYKPFAVEILKRHEVRVPAADALAREAREHERPWQLATSVQQVLERRNLFTSQPPAASRIYNPELDLWEESTRAVHSKEEGEAYLARRIHDIVEYGTFAEMRGRLAAGTKGLAQCKRLHAEDLQRRKESTVVAELNEHAKAQQEWRREADAARREGRIFLDENERRAKTMWEQHQKNVQRLGGLTPGAAIAAKYRSRAQ